MGAALLFKGILVGLLASIPLGPIGVMCIQRTLSRNHRSGFVSGLGAACADTIFATLALFSLTLVLTFIENNIMLIKALGGICVIIVGVKIFLSNPVVQIRKNRAGKTNLWQDFISMFLITLTNPAFILIFVALFAAFGISREGLGNEGGALMIAGVLSGASLWWFSLTFVVGLLRRRFRPRHLLWINRISGAVIVLLGAAAILLMFVNTPVDGILPHK